MTLTACAINCSLAATGQRESSTDAMIGLLVSELKKRGIGFDGTIRIADTPDRGRLCEQTKSWRFAITQRRKYYRLREFEWCDGLTDYIDIYKPANPR